MRTKQNTCLSLIGINCCCLRIPPNKAQHELFMFGKNSISIFSCFNAVLQNIRTLWNFLSFQCSNLHKEMMRGPEKTCYETQAGAFDQHERKVQRLLENKDLYNILGLFCEEGFREWRQKGHSGRGGDHLSIEIMSSWADAHFWCPGSDLFLLGWAGCKRHYEAKQSNDVFQSVGSPLTKAYPLLEKTTKRSLA